MAKASGRKLKVFQAQFGFYDTVVAAPSRAAALRAWGTRQDLFASGEAIQITDEAAVAAASAYPETPLRRAVGSTDAFVLEPTNLPKVPDAPAKPAVKPATAQPAAPARPLADRSKLDAAETALSALDDARKREEGDFRREAEDLETRRAAAQAAYVEARKAATSKVVEARSAFRKAGGAD
jgi:hypothetical protein